MWVLSRGTDYRRGMNLTWLGLGCLGGVLLWFASDHFVMLLLGLLLGVALGIGFGNNKPE